MKFSSVLSKLCSLVNFKAQWRKRTERASRRESSMPPRQRLQFEAVEPRVLLSADVSYVATGAADLSLKIVAAPGGPGAPTLELIDNVTHSVLGSTLLNAAREIDIAGSNAADKLAIDLSYAGSFSPVPITVKFTGNDGQDAVDLHNSGGPLYTPQTFTLEAPESVLVSNNIATLGDLHMSATDALTVDKGAHVTSTDGGSITLQAPSITVQPGAAVESLAGKTTTPGDITLLAVKQVTDTGGVATSATAATAGIAVHDATLSGHNISLLAGAGLNVTSTGLLDRQDADLSVIRPDGHASVLVDGASSIHATEDVTMTALSSVQASATAQAGSTTNTSKDAAVAMSFVTSDASVEVGGTS
ncbi:MAG: LEPR-XLL domain-containing protein, partial [Betaproteobacteria bacterium]